MNTMTLKHDMEALGFDELEQDIEVAKLLGNREFMRDAMLIRFFGSSIRMQWAHIIFDAVGNAWVGTYKDTDGIIGKPEAELIEEVAEQGYGFPALMRYLKGLR